MVSSLKGDDVMGKGKNVEIVDLESEDELDITYSHTHCSNRDIIGPSTSYSGGTSPMMINRLLEMGFQDHIVSRALKENGTREQKFDQSDDEIFFDDEETFCPPNFSLLLGLGYSKQEALNAIDKCGDNAHPDALIQFIAAASFACNNSDALQQESTMKKSHTLNSMTGLGIPGIPLIDPNRKIPSHESAPPFFYFENSAYPTSGLWPTIQNLIYGIQPEFEDSIHFGVASRQRGYVHNLPVDGRFQLTPLPERTIQEAFPERMVWWPSWDNRTKLNCIVAKTASMKLRTKIRNTMYEFDVEVPPSDVINNMLVQLCKWNLIWVAKNRVTNLEPYELEKIMGYPEYHTRGGGILRTDRHEFLANSFHVDTIAYHLSVLKKLFPEGIRVLSLFSGIGGAEVALHKLGIPLKVVVAVEVSERCQVILKNWWEISQPNGILIQFPDVRLVEEDVLKDWISRFGKFDLVIGASPCNDLQNGNQVSRVKFEGPQSEFYYEFHRILNLVTELQSNL